MAGSGVLARRNGYTLSKTSGGTRWRRQVRERFDIRKTEADEIRDAQWARPRDVAESVAAHVSVVSGIRQLSDADTIEYDPDYAFKAHRCGF